MWKAIVLAAFCAVIATPAAADLKDDIQKADDEFSAAFNRGDGSGVADFYTDDAIALPPGADMVVGKDNILAFWTQTVSQLTDLQAKVIAVLPLGETYAREIGVFSFKTRANPAQEIAGKYVVLWRKVDGRWKLNTDIWNANK